MKKIVLILAVLSAVVLNAGVYSEGVTSKGREYTIWDKGGYYSIAMSESIDRKIYAGKAGAQKMYKDVLYTQLNVAAKETKKMGYNYFVIVNSNVNNLNGFPLNNAKNLYRFLSLQSRKPSFSTDGQERKPSSIISSGGMRILFKPVPSSMLKNGLISVWSVKQTLKDTK